MKRLNRLIALFLIAGLFLSASNSAKLSTFVVTNRDPYFDVHFKMTGISTKSHYYLTVPKAEARGFATVSVFEIHKDIYDIAIYACGVKVAGTLNLMRNERLVVQSCDRMGTTPNAGEPSLEKYDFLKSAPADALPDYQYPQMFLPPYHAHIHWLLDLPSFATGSVDYFEPFWP